ncbi:MAG: hypothetical protein U0235_10375 [Polyangiaceae bacterium]
MMLAAGAAAAVGCDQGVQHDDRVVGPPVRVVGTNLGMGGAPKGAIAANGALEIAFDRVLDPASVNRQAAVIIRVGGGPIANPAVAYDPVTRVLRLSAANESGAPWLTPGQPYELILTDPNEPNSIGGVRALDGATIDHAGPRRIAFFASDELPKDALLARGIDPVMDFCRDVLPIFRAKCAGSTCHGEPGTTAGLVLTSAAGVANTALRRAAIEANTGSRAGLGGTPGRVFGVDLPVIEPGNPAASWLMYKLLLAVPADDVDGGAVATAARCDGAPGPAPTPPRLPLAPFAALDSAERTRFADAMLGSPMPYPARPGVLDREQNLTLSELERVRAWIAQGAQISECGACVQ